MPLEDRSNEILEIQLETLKEIRQLRTEFGWFRRSVFFVGAGLSSAVAWLFTK